MKFSPLVVLDLEATCWSSDDHRKSTLAMEVIEIGAVLANIDTGEIIDNFQTFVFPSQNPELSDFCMSLTGIKQSDIDGAPKYPEAMYLFDTWLAGTGSQIWASWGAYDLRQLRDDASYHGVLPGALEKTHINLKRPWRKTTKHKKQSLRAALEYHDMRFEGVAHRALDDARNISRLLPFIDSTILYEEAVLMGAPSSKSPP